MTNGSDLREIIDEVVPQQADRQISVGTYLVVGLINRALDPNSKNGILRYREALINGWWACTSGLACPSWTRSTGATGTMPACFPG